MKKINVIISVTLMLILSGCSRLTQENYDQLRMGMAKVEVEAILGEATKCEVSVGVETCVWGSEEGRHVKIRFAAGNAVTFSNEGLN